MLAPLAPPPAAPAAPATPRRAAPRDVSDVPSLPAPELEVPAPPRVSWTRFAVLLCAGLIALFLATD